MRGRAARPASSATCWGRRCRLSWSTCWSPSWSADPAPLAPATIARNPGAALRFVSAPGGPRGRVDSAMKRDPRGDRRIRLAALKRTPPRAPGRPRGGRPTAAGKATTNAGNAGAASACVAVRRTADPSSPGRRGGAASDPPPAGRRPWCRHRQAAVPSAGHRRATDGQSTERHPGRGRCREAG